MFKNELINEIQRKIDICDSIITDFKNKKVSEVSVNDIIELRIRESQICLLADFKNNVLNLQ